ncbi:MAG: restriction endonuclease subunit R [Microcoleus sp. PH2017_10_PVI_O_A]|uniref:type I restriction endonuclease n=1 Tax=unclassified Microcoleus TaxID=2642155 RepID=UPI001DFD28E7|nr:MULTISPECIES: type I restriction endonuclease [unclassified Microcoleus]TAE78189.1 MAG: restriction endonuclease subunit R [Oscillatoriales cyanobacterium]MCC3408874.1 restriction endonuclease subunit R [Microcoleus sp. PH2017_10_PVI_O_A]MCC3463008.1 restriction endonuclease subunit R [Microcoleus sp. PH2017_11_PCY_U_A]MCC3481406.1 restriction endonuclease subunit R [Microcoleus sp. PH2017_12_PCY_D_A]MCC3531393.1 restriction endonuclease subunit R [Microcoleus sp. PH2017_21_RUC_O_A]
MTQSIQAKALTLRDVKTKFNLQLSEDEQFFREWIDDLPEITDAEKRSLDKVKAGYINSTSYPFLEDTVKMVVLAPLLFVADFFLTPFHIECEKSVELIVEDEDIIVRGSIDVLLLLQSFWVVAIEAKRSQYSVEAGLPQLLFYMLNDPNSEQPTFGLLTNGSSFRFIKVTKQDTPQYALSKLFDIQNPGNELYEVFRIFKRIAAVVSSYNS